MSKRRKIWIEAKVGFKVAALCCRGNGKATARMGGLLLHRAFPGSKACFPPRQADLGNDPARVMKYDGRRGLRHRASAITDSTTTNICRC